MSQDFNTVSNRKARRAARNNRNRPVLVAGSSQEQDGQVDEAVEATETPASPTSSTAVQELSPLVVPTPEPTPKKRRFAGFLPASNKEASEEQPKAKEVDPTEARLARATRKVPAVPPKSAAVKEDGGSAKAVAETKSTHPAASSTAKTGSSNRAAAPASPFKTRYIFGMVLYLLCANFIGIFETSILQQYHLDSVLTTFNLFGGQMIIRTSTLTFLVTLIVILVILARLDLIPRSLGAATGAQTGKTSASSRSTSSTGERSQSSIRQGVKGADDDLYMQYRTAQRRQKK